MGQNSSKRRSFTPGQVSKSRVNGDVKANGSIELHEGDDVTVDPDVSISPANTSTSSANKSKGRKKFKFIGFSLKRTPSGRWSRKRRSQRSLRTPNGSARPVSCPNPSTEEQKPETTPRPQSLFLDEIDVNEDESKIDTVDLSDHDDDDKNATADPPVPKERTKKKKSSKKGSKKGSKREKGKKTKRAPEIPSASADNLAEIGASEIKNDINIAAEQASVSVEKKIETLDLESAVKLATDGELNSESSEHTKPETNTAIELHSVEDQENKEHPSDIQAAASSIVNDSVSIAQQRLINEYKDESTESNNSKAKSEECSEEAEESKSSFSSAFSSAKNVIEQKFDDIKDRFSNSEEQDDTKPTTEEEEINTVDETHEKSLVDEVMAEVDHSSVVSKIPNDNKGLHKLDLEQPPVTALAEDIEKDITDGKKSLTSIQFDTNEKPTNGVLNTSDFGALNASQGPNLEEIIDFQVEKAETCFTETSKETNDTEPVETPSAQTEDDVPAVATKVVESVISASISKEISAFALNAEDDKHAGNHGPNSNDEEKTTGSKNEVDQKIESEESKKFDMQTEKEKLKRQKSEEKAKEKERIKEEKRRKAGKNKLEKKKSIPQRISDFFSKKHPKPTAETNIKSPASEDEALGNSLSDETTPPQTPDQATVEVAGCSKDFNAWNVAAVKEVASDEDTKRSNQGLTIDVSVEPLAKNAGRQEDNSPDSAVLVSSEPSSPEELGSAPTSPGSDSGTPGGLKKISLGPRLRTAILQKKSSSASDSGKDDNRLSLTQPKAMETTEFSPTPPPRKIGRRPVEQYSPITAGAHNKQQLIESSPKLIKCEMPSEISKIVEKETLETKSALMKETEECVNDSCEQKQIAVDEIVNSFEQNPGSLEDCVQSSLDNKEIVVDQEVNMTEHSLVSCDFSKGILNTQKDQLDDAPQPADEVNIKVNDKIEEKKSIAKELFSVAKENLVSCNPLSNVSEADVTGTKTDFSLSSCEHSSNNDINVDINKDICKKDILTEANDAEDSDSSIEVPKIVSSASIVLRASLSDDNIVSSSPKEGDHMSLPVSNSSVEATKENDSIFESSTSGILHTTPSLDSPVLLQKERNSVQQEERTSSDTEEAEESKSSFFSAFSSAKSFAEQKFEDIKDSFSSSEDDSQPKPSNGASNDTDECPDISKDTPFVASIDESVIPTLPSTTSKAICEAEDEKPTVMTLAEFPVGILKSEDAEQDCQISKEQCPKVESSQNLSEKRSVEEELIVKTIKAPRMCEKIPTTVDQQSVKCDTQINEGNATIKEPCKKVAKESIVEKHYGNDMLCNNNIVIIEKKDDHQLESTKPKEEVAEELLVKEQVDRKEKTTSFFGKRVDKVGELTSIGAGESSVEENDTVKKEADKYENSPSFFDRLKDKVEDFAGVATENNSKESENTVEKKEIDEENEPASEVVGFQEKKNGDIVIEKETEENAGDSESSEGFFGRMKNKFEDLTSFGSDEKEETKEHVNEDEHDSNENSKSFFDRMKDKVGGLTANEDVKDSGKEESQENLKETSDDSENSQSIFDKLKDKVGEITGLGNDSDEETENEEAKDNANICESSVDSEPTEKLVNGVSSGDESSTSQDSLKTDATIEAYLKLQYADTADKKSGINTQDVLDAVKDKTGLNGDSLLEKIAVNGNSYINGSTDQNSKTSSVVVETEKSFTEVDTTSG